jgi:hypothetical protein
MLLLLAAAPRARSDCKNLCRANQGSRRGASPPRLQLPPHRPPRQGIKTFTLKPQPKECQHGVPIEQARRARRPRPAPPRPARPPARASHARRRSVRAAVRDVLARALSAGSVVRAQQGRREAQLDRLRGAPRARGRGGRRGVEAPGARLTEASGAGTHCALLRRPVPMAARRCGAMTRAPERTRAWARRGTGRRRSRTRRRSP